MRGGVNERRLRWIERAQKRILRLAAAGSVEQTKGSIVAQAVVEREAWRDAPGVFGVKTQTLHVLREAAIADGSESAARGDVGSELRGIGEIKRRVLRERDKRFRCGGEGAAQNRLVNEIDSETRGVVADGVADVVAKLIFFLVARDGERGDRGNELIVAERFEPGDGASRGAEGKREREAEIRVARFREMQAAGVENE
jgi:hypothetical protein